MRAILQHVIEAEVHYARGITALRGLQQPARAPVAPAPRSSVGARRRLEAARRDLLASFEGVDEETFYRLRKIPTQEQAYGQEYSVLSALENLAMHDREHTTQISAILAPTREPPSAPGERGSR